MKNSDEFRRLVFEKAEAYEKRRRARNKKIVNSVVVCSLLLALCLPVGLHVYRLQNDDFLETTAAEGPTEASPTIPETTTVQIEQTTATMTTTTTPPPRETTTAQTYTTTTASMENTYAETTCKEITQPTQTTTTACETTAAQELGFGSHEVIGNCSYDAFSAHFSDVRIIRNVIDNADTLEEFLSAHTALYGENILNALTRYDAEYFSQYNLVIVQSCHWVNSIQYEENCLTVTLMGGTPRDGRMNFFTIEKDDTFILKD